MKDSQSLRTPAASAAKVGMAAALAAGMAIATPTAAFAAGEDQDVSVASENASDSYYYIGDSSYGLSTYLSEAVAQGSTKIHVGTSFTDKGTVTIPSSITELSGYSEGFFSSGPKTVDFGYSYKMTVVFPSGSDLSVDRINFYKRNSSDAEGAYVEVQKGAFELLVFQYACCERYGGVRKLHLCDGADRKQWLRNVYRQHERAREHWRACRILPGPCIQLRIGKGILCCRSGQPGQPNAAF